MEEQKKPTFWQKHGHKILTVGLIILTGGVVYFASQEGFKSIMDNYHVKVDLGEKVNKIISDSQQENISEEIEAE